jgi:hypothetical protein
MSIHEIITIEDRNTGEIHLHKEGIFWKAYQQSTYLFTREVKALTASIPVRHSTKRQGCQYLYIVSGLMDEKVTQNE